MVVSHMDGRFLWVNHAAEDLLGFSPFEFIGLHGKPGLRWTDLTVKATDLEADQAMVQELEKGSRVEYTLEKSYLAKDGTPIPTKIHVLRWPPDGDCDCFLVTILPLDAQNEMLREEILQMRHALAEFMTEQRTSKVWGVVVSLAKWADSNRLFAVGVVLFFMAFFAGDRVLDIADRMRVWVSP